RLEVALIPACLLYRCRMRRRGLRQGGAGLWPIPKLAGYATDLFSQFLVFVNDRARKVVQFVTEV
ncbi:hypothetical protein PX122_31960, partial [Pseudomonas aeruginosa]|uniref:hypothetical protein n=1 Tax=Pseudomonas aeruginosa TaxID=287 RepID=UPI002F42B487